MGTWNHSILGNDVSTQVHATYIEYIEAGTSAKEAERLVRNDFSEEFADHENEFNAVFALALAKWEKGNLDAKSRVQIRDLIVKNAEKRIYSSLEYGEEDVASRERALSELLEKLGSASPAKKPLRRRKPVITFKEKFKLTSVDGRLIVNASESFVDGVYRATSCSAMWENSGGGGVFQYSKEGTALRAKWDGSSSIKVFHEVDIVFQQKLESLQYYHDVLRIEYFELAKESEH